MSPFRLTSAHALPKVPVSTTSKPQIFLAASIASFANTSCHGSKPASPARSALTNHQYIFFTFFNVLRGATFSRPPREVNTIRFRKIQIGGNLDDGHLQPTTQKRLPSAAIRPPAAGNSAPIPGDPVILNAGHAINMKINETSAITAHLKTVVGQGCGLLQIAATSGKSSAQVGGLLWKICRPMIEFARAAMNAPMKIAAKNAATVSAAFSVNPIGIFKLHLVGIDSITAVRPFRQAAKAPIETRSVPPSSRR
jgi:hypothetical protein